MAETPALINPVPIFEPVPIADLGANVRAYDADPTGERDSTAAFRNAWKDSPLIYAPPGLYQVNLDMDSTGKHFWASLVGAGMEQTRIKPPVGQAAFTFPNLNGGLYGPLWFRDFQIEGSTTPTEKGFLPTGSTLQIRCENVKFKNLLRSLDTGDLAVETTYSRWTDCEFDNAPLYMRGLAAHNALAFTRTRWVATSQTVHEPAVTIDGMGSDGVSIEFDHCQWETLPRQALKLRSVKSVFFHDGYMEFVNQDGAASTPWLDIDSSVGNLNIKDFYFAGNAPHVLVGTSAVGTQTSFGAHFSTIQIVGTATIDYSHFPDYVLFPSVSEIATKLGRGVGNELHLGSATGSKIGFYGVTPITRALLATGVGHTVDDVITALQNLGLVRQS